MARIRSRRKVSSVIKGGLLAMFCNQCEQTISGSGCVKIGSCGKDSDVQSLQDILLYGFKGYFRR